MDLCRLKCISKGDFFTGILLRENHWTTSEESKRAMISGWKKMSRLDFQRHVGKTKLTNKVTFKGRQFWSRICFELALQVSICQEVCIYLLFIYTGSMVSLGDVGFMMFSAFESATPRYLSTIMVKCLGSFWWLGLSWKLSQVVIYSLSQKRFLRYDQISIWYRVTQNDWIVEGSLICYVIPIQKPCISHILHIRVYTCFLLVSVHYILDNNIIYTSCVRWHHMGLSPFPCSSGS